MALTELPGRQFVDVNDAFLQTLGYARDEVLGRTATELGLFPDTRGHQAAAEQLRETGRLASRELEVRRKDGSTIRGLFWGEALEDQGRTLYLTVMVNIEERRRAQEAGQEVSLRLQESIRAANVGLWDWDLRTDHVRFSREWKSQLGLGEDEVADNLSEWKRLVHPDDRDAALAFVREAIDARQDRLQGEFRMRHRDGTYRWILAQASIHKDGQGTAVRVLGSHVDVTRLKEQEEHIRLLGKMLDAAPASISIHDTQGRFHFANRVTASMHGYADAAEFTGMNLRDVDVPTSAALREERFRHVARDGEARFEVEHFRKDRSVLPLEVLAKVIEWKGQPAILSVATDITAHRAAREHRRRQLVFSRALNEIAEVVLAQDQADEILQRTNRVVAEALQADRTLIYDVSFARDRINAACEWLGVEHQDVVPTKGQYTSLDPFRTALLSIRESRRPVESHVDDVNHHFAGQDAERLLHHQLKVKSLLWYPLHFDDDGYHLLTLNRVLAQRPWAQDELDFLASASKQVSLALMKIRLVEKERVARLEHERLREQLAQAQKMESVGRLAGGVAHDFNNMLNVILGRVELVLEDLPGDSPQREDIKEIRAAAERSAALTRQLLAFARKQPVAPRPVDLNGSVTGMLQILRRLVGEDVEIRFQPGPLDGAVVLDPAQLDQVLANLCVNARDAMARTVTIRTSRVAMDQEACLACPEATPGPYALLAITDDGKGMDAETMTHLFEPFFTTKEVGRGTGLGLATVYGITKQNNGFITARSQVGGGTTLGVHLPLHARAVEAPTPPGERSPRTGGQETVLLVEDEPMILRMAAAVLTRQGHAVLAAASPAQALRLAQEHAGAIHLVVTDVVMPHMNGRDLVEEVQRLHPAIKHLFISGYTGDVLAHHGVHGGKPFLQKPFTPQVLLAKVREVLGG
jgi:PAS domain S-box-containing protein